MTRQRTVVAWHRLGRFDASGRLLMLISPKSGLKRSEMWIGRWDWGVKPGWNRLQPEGGKPERFVYIDAGSGLSTNVPPEEAEIHDVVEEAPPRLERSVAWVNLMQDGVFLVGNGELDRLQFASRFQCIRHASSHPPDAETLLQACHECILKLREVLVEARHVRVAPSELVRKLEWPAIDVIQQYLELRMTGGEAAEILAAVLSAQCAMPRLWPPAMPSAVRPAVIEHLSSVVYELIALRDNLNAEGYYEATYLAGLYTRVGILLASGIDFDASSLTDDEILEIYGFYEKDQISRIHKLKLNLDEMFAHHIAPVFLLPALFTAPDILVYLVDRSDFRGSKLEDEMEFFQVHPALREAIRESLHGPKPAVAVAEQFYRRSQAMATFDAVASLNGFACPFAEEARDSMKSGLLPLLFPIPI